MMQGTIRRNNVLEPMSPYGCWSDTPKLRVEKDVVFHGVGEKLVEMRQGFFGGPVLGINNVGTTKNWPHVMSRQCRYDRKAQDERCAGCQVEYDNQYVESLR